MAHVTASLALPSVCGPRLVTDNHTHLRVTNEKYSRDLGFINILASAKDKRLKVSASAVSMSGAGPSTASMRSSASVNFKVAEGLGRNLPAKPSGRRQPDPVRVETEEELLKTKRRVYKLRNELARSRSTAATLQMHAQNAIAAQEVRDETRQLQGAHLHHSVTPVEPATVEEVGRIATILMREHHAIEPDEAKRKWYKLFKDSDADGDGHITYKELMWMVRKIMKVPKEKVSETAIQAVWHSIDLDGNGWIDAGEFGRFFRLGEKPVKDSRRKKEEEPKVLVVEKELEEPSLAELQIVTAIKNRKRLEAEEKQRWLDEQTAMTNAFANMYESNNGG